MAFDNVTKEFKIGKYTVPSRIILPPMATGKSPDGSVTDKLLEYYKKLAENPYIGIIMTEHSYVNIQGKAHDNQLSADGTADASTFKKLTEIIHTAKKGTLAIQQISHAGNKASEKWTHSEILGPSDDMNKDEKVRAMTISEIKSLEEDFVNAAKRAEEYGFDGIELHAAHGYLLSQFYSPITNRRDDEYGASSVENRVRVITEIIEKTKKAVSPDFLVGLRFGACDRQADGSGATVGDAVKAAELFEKAGADFIDISAGVDGVITPKDPKDRFPGFFKEESKIIKDAVDVPVFTCGGVKKIAEADDLIKDGYADMIGIGRALLAKADLSE